MLVVAEPNFAGSRLSGAAQYPPPPSNPRL